MPLIKSVGQTKSDKQRSSMDGNFLITGAAQGFGKEFTRRVLRGTSICCFHLSKNKFANTSFTSWAAHCAKHCKRHHMDQGNERRLTLKFNEHLWQFLTAIGLSYLTAFKIAVKSFYQVSTAFSAAIEGFVSLRAVDTCGQPRQWTCTTQDFDIDDNFSSWRQQRQQSEQACADLLSSHN